MNQKETILFLEKELQEIDSSEKFMLIWELTFCLCIIIVGLIFGGESKIILGSTGLAFMYIFLKYIIKEIKKKKTIISCPHCDYMINQEGSRYDIEYTIETNLCSECDKNIFIENEIEKAEPTDRTDDFATQSSSSRSTELHSSS